MSKYSVPVGIAACYADATKAKEELGWVAEKGIEDMCRDAWGFIQNTCKEKHNNI